MNGRLQSELSIELRNDDKAATMPSYVFDWYMNLKASRKTAATCRDYLRKVNNFLSYINANVAKVTTDDITERKVTGYFISIQRKVVNGEVMSTSDSYQSTVWSCLDNFLGYLLDHGMIERNYIRGVSKPRNHDLDRINENRILLTEDDFKRILSAVNCESDSKLQKRDKALLLLFMNTGIRRTAMSNVMVSDIDFESRTLRIIDKGTKRHEYVLNTELIRTLNDWLSVREVVLRKNNHKAKDEGYLFVTANGGGMSDETISYTVEKYTKIALGHSVSPHKLRSGYCSILYNKTGDIEFVRRAVGHSRVDTTQRYIVTKGSEKEKAAEIMEGLL